MRYIAGRYYTVPCVQGVWFPYTFGPKRRWFVVMLPKHEDREHFDFEFEHYHLHPQFLSDKLYYTDAGRYPAWANVPLHDMTEGNDIELMSDVVYKRRKCRRPMPEHFGGYNAPEVIQRLQETYKGQKIKCGKCPHRGIELHQQRGRVVCPGHGLVFQDGTCIGRVSNETVCQT